MLKNKTVAVVVPAYNEGNQIQMVIETMPDFVDRIVIVNDCSQDNTKDAVKEYWQTTKNKTNLVVKDNLSDIQKDTYNYADYIVQEENKKEIKFFNPCKVLNNNQNAERIILLDHLQNGGVGAAIASGYKWCKDHSIDCTAVMAGDGQMDPAELESICLPVIENNIDYVKGNRLIHRSSWLTIPKIRYFGNSVLSILTKIASGYWHVSDTQTGYTALSRKAINAIELHKIYKSYGMPNDMLVKLNIAFCTLKEIEIKPVYNVGEQSKMKILKVIPRVSFLLIKSFFKRLWTKYLLKDFHPLFILYHVAFACGALSIPFAIEIFDKFMKVGEVVSGNNLVIFVFLIITCFQSLLFAMWMDIHDNEKLYK